MDRDDGQNATTASPRRADGWWLWWPLLVGPAAMALVYAFRALGWTALAGSAGKAMLEQTALVLLALALGANLGRCRDGADPWHRVLAILAAIFFCRELHFAGTGVGVYAGLAVVAALIALRWRRLRPRWFAGQFRFWLVATGATYLLSQLVARRLFRGLGLPAEAEVHVALEECVENAAHLLLLAATLAAPAGRRAEP